jgi:hypothetical protein
MMMVMPVVPVMMMVPACLSQRRGESQDRDEDACRNELLQHKNLLFGRCGSQGPHPISSYHFVPLTGAERNQVRFHCAHLFPLWVWKISAIGWSIRLLRLCARSTTPHLFHANFLFYGMKLPLQGRGKETKDGHYV